jgi:FkbM family methyltransferase
MTATADRDAIVRALRLLGANPNARAKLVAALRACEPLLAAPGVNVRDHITGPIVDALYPERERVDVELAGGVKFTALYTSQISRDLVLRDVERPDHIFEPQTTKTLLRLARDARHAIVGGAYSGDHAILLAAAMAPHGGVVHAFEPNPHQQAMLRENAAANRLTNLRAVPLGLWDDAAVRLSFVGADALASTMPAPDGAIATTTIDEYCRAEGVPAIDLVMLDIEGSELPALRGGRATLSAHPPAIVFEIHSSYTDWADGLRATPIGRFLVELGYELYGIRDFQSHVAMPDLPVELVPADTAYLEGPPHGFNMLALHDRALLDDPLFRVVENVSPKLLHHRDPALHYPLAWQTRR